MSSNARPSGSEGAEGSRWERNCAECRFWDVDPFHGESGRSPRKGVLEMRDGRRMEIRTYAQGWCREDSPTLTRRGNRDGWPRTKGDDWCGKWRHWHEDYLPGLAELNGARDA